MGKCDCLGEILAITLFTYDHAPEELRCTFSRHHHLFANSHLSAASDTTKGRRERGFGIFSHIRIALARMDFALTSQPDIAADLM